MRLTLVNYICKTRYIAVVKVNNNYWYHMRRSKGLVALKLHAKDNISRADFFYSI